MSSGREKHPSEQKYKLHVIQSPLQMWGSKPQREMCAHIVYQVSVTFMMLQLENCLYRRFPSQTLSVDD